MGTILKDSIDTEKRFFSLDLKFLFTYLTLVVVVIVIMNTYPIIASRNLVFASKQTAMVNNANQIGASLGNLDTLNTNAVAKVLDLLDTGKLSQITVVNSDFDVVYQNIRSNVAGNVGAEGLIGQSMDGEDLFFSKFENGAFYSSAAVPIVSNGDITGSVYVFEYDDEEGEVILALQRNIQRISIGITVLSVLFSVVCSKNLTHRIKSVLEAIKNVREGEYTYRVDIGGHDEISTLAGEFNSLTSRLQNTEETRRRFVADASHELKTPLASIRLLSDSILQNSGMDRDTVNEFVSDIRDESERLARTTGHLLDLTKTDYNISTVRSCVDCAEVAARVERMLQPIADEKKVSLNFTMSDNCMVLASDDDIYQIIFNLAENAIKYSNENGNVYVHITNDAENAEIIVEDDGIGIPAQDMPYIFDRFYRVDKSRARGSGGSGLGLSIVKSTAEKHGGEVTAENLETGGMHFAVKFPLYVSGKKGV